MEQSPSPASVPPSSIHRTRTLFLHRLVPEPQPGESLLCLIMIRNGMERVVHALIPDAPTSEPAGQEDEPSLGSVIYAICVHELKKWKRVADNWTNGRAAR